MAAESEFSQRSLVDALDEPALVVEGLAVSTANSAARDLFGRGIEGRDVRLAIRQPDLLEHILSGHEGDLDVAGVGEFERPWRVAIRSLGLGTVFVRLIDRSENLAAEKMRVDFVANASHELRTPLSAVLGYAETLAEEPGLPDETIGQFGTTIRDEARRMLRIVEDLMSLSRIEADRFLVPGEEVDLTKVVEAAIANAAPIRGRKGCEVTLKAPKGLPKVRGDDAQLVQLFDNLVTNALRYGCEKAGSEVVVELDVAGNLVEARVIDRGPGIPRQHLPRVTERFYRVDEARSRESGGTGLGLAIVKHIVERHRGQLAIDSIEGVGTTVTVTLPKA
jgi:two-component system phosphate regulon sensor histidine kinase PhoR